MIILSNASVLSPTRASCTARKPQVNKYSLECSSLKHMGEAFMQTVLNWFKITGCIAVVLLLAGRGITSTKPIPDHATVYLHAGTNEYFVLSCTPQYAIDRPQLVLEVKISTARGMEATPFADCTNQGVWFSESRSLSGMLFEKLGIFGPLPYRWNEDGTWNW